MPAATVERTAPPVCPACEGTEVMESPGAASFDRASSCHRR
jgi:hypothetical protein